MRYVCAQVCGLVAMYVMVEVWEHICGNSGGLGGFGEVDVDCCLKVCEVGNACHEYGVWVCEGCVIDGRVCVGRYYGCDE